MCVCVCVYSVYGNPQIIWVQKVGTVSTDVKPSVFFNPKLVRLGCVGKRSNRCRGLSSNPLCVYIYIYIYITRTGKMFSLQSIK